MAPPVIMPTTAELATFLRAWTYGTNAEIHEDFDSTTRPTGTQAAQYLSQGQNHVMAAIRSEPHDDWEQGMANGVKQLIIYKSAQLIDTGYIAEGAAVGDLFDRWKILYDELMPDVKAWITQWDDAHPGVNPDAKPRAVLSHYNDLFYDPMGVYQPGKPFGQTAFGYWIQNTDGTMTWVVRNWPWVAIT